MLAYLLARDALRFLFRPWLPLAWPIQIALILIVSAVVIAAVYMAAMVIALRWAWRRLLL